MASCHLVFYLEGSLLAAPFDAEHIHLTGPEVRVMDGAGKSDEAPQFDISQNGFWSTVQMSVARIVTGLRRFRRMSAIDSRRRARGNATPRHLLVSLARVVNGGIPGAIRPRR
jgi:hypothetical protein